jgi:hypothetical protein
MHWRCRVWTQSYIYANAIRPYVQTPHGPLAQPTPCASVPRAVAIEPSSNNVLLQQESVLLGALCCHVARDCAQRSAELNTVSTVSQACRAPRASTAFANAWATV